MSQGLLLDVDPYARRDDDFYATPAWMTRALLRRLRLNPRLRVLEPCAGDGAIVRELPSTVDVMTNDIVARDPMVPDFLLDAGRADTWRAFEAAGAIDVVLTNPPFDETFAIAQQALNAAVVGMVLLQRVTWIEPTIDRGPWLREHPPTRVIVLPRWNFRSVDGTGGNDSAPPAWWVWAKQRWFCGPGIEVVTRDERDEIQAQVARERAGL